MATLSRSGLEKVRLRQTVWRASSDQSSRQESTATFLMAADAPGRAKADMLRTYLGSANPS